MLRTSQILGSKVFKHVSKTNQINIKFINTSTWLSAGKLGNIVNFFVAIAKRFVLERRYTDKHEWVEIDGRTGIIGISHYAQVSN